MGMEDIDYAANGAVNKVTDYGIGAGSIDAMYVTQSGSTTAVYPLYGAHGNMISTLTRYGTAGYTTSNYRTFDAWGNIRVGQATGDPKGRYCANLGHKQDDESGLLYMRARYYEPSSGRFISQDESHYGSNWFTFADNNPAGEADPSGCYPYLFEAMYNWQNSLMITKQMIPVEAAFLALFTGLLGLNAAISGVGAPMTVARANVLARLQASYEAQAPLSGMGDYSIKDRSAALLNGYASCLWLTGFFLGLWGPGSVDD